MPALARALSSPRAPRASPTARQEEKVRRSLPSFPDIERSRVVHLSVFRRLRPALCPRRRTQCLPAPRQLAGRLWPSPRVGSRGTRCLVGKRVVVATKYVRSCEITLGTRHLSARLRITHVPEWALTRGWQSWLNKSRPVKLPLERAPGRWGGRFRNWLSCARLLPGIETRRVRHPPSI